MFLINVSTKCFYHLINEQSYFYLSLDQSTVPPILVRLLRRMVSQLTGASTSSSPVSTHFRPTHLFYPIYLFHTSPLQANSGYSVYIFGLRIQLVYLAYVHTAYTFYIFNLCTRCVYSNRLHSAFTGLLRAARLNSLLIFDIDSIGLL